MDDDAIVYLDHAATSPVLAEVLEAMLPFYGEEFGNPSGLHRLARRARRALDDARDELAAALGAHGDEIVFTSGATESDNLAVTGAVRSPGALVVSAIEHAAVLRPAERLGARLAPVDRSGRVALGALEALLDESVELVSVMAANSEVGTVQPLAEIASLARAHAPTALLHSDAAQALRWCDVASMTADYDLVSVSGHKLGAPKGVGALVVRRGARPRLRPVLVGGGQEWELRAGTQNVAGAVALARAASIAVARRNATAIFVGRLAARLADGVRARVPGAEMTVAAAERVPGICHLRLPGVDAEELVIVLDDLGVCCSSGAACASGATEPSHVLLAMGYEKDEAREGIRLSLGPQTRESEIDRALDGFGVALERLRR